MSCWQATQRIKTIRFAPHSNESLLMPALMKFLHVLAAIAWLGGISFMLFALAWASIAILLLSGLAMLLAVGMKNAPAGWHAMLGIGLVMFALFGHLYFGPFRRLKQAVSASNWPEGGRRVGQIATLALVNLVLGVLAIAAVFFMV